MRPHRPQPTRLPRLWDSPGKNTGVGCHFLLQCMKVKSESEVTQSCPTLSDPMDCSLSGSSIREIFQARVLEWGAIAFSNRCSRKISKSDYFFLCFLMTGGICVCVCLCVYTLMCKHVQTPVCTIINPKAKIPINWYFAQQVLYVNFLMLHLAVILTL